ncbi:hypothetical protein J1N35_029818 [Gossypium stocksii]|uniref:Kinesin motor domain-containing protein n=1 Tax=Gossypium stocksii TaxID=47602 RepID=A0A9D3UYN2_9ROSI|nr:hypothetical protein J1N35_029818 [Gossypium stocksii]
MGAIGGEELKKLEKEQKVQLAVAREERILVLVRLRPLSDQKIVASEVANWECINERTILYRNTLREGSTFPSAYIFDNTQLRLRDDPERGTIVEKVIEEPLKDWNHLKEFLAICEAQRRISETSLNERSSQSHQIIRLTIKSSTREFLGKENSTSLAISVNFIDLAGSERASQALSTGARLKKGCHINRSLLILSTVVRKLR